ncbi:MAG: hypothetical protein AAGF31_08445 [Planctomycetota bacterium]
MTYQSVLLMISALLTAASVGESGAQAGENQERGPRGPRDPERMQRILERFDEDGDGELSLEERQTARETIMSERGARDGRRDGRRGGEAGKRRGAGGPGGFGGRMDPETLFDRIDADGDGTITKDQFVTFVTEMRAKWREMARERRGDGGFRGEGRRPRPRPPVEESGSDAQGGDDLGSGSVSEDQPADD